MRFVNLLTRKNAGSNEETLLQPDQQATYSLPMPLREATIADQAQTDESFEKHMQALLPPDLATIVGAYLPKRNFEEINTFIALAACYKSSFDAEGKINDSFEKFFPDAEKISQQLPVMESVRAVLAYILNKHPEWRYKDIHFRTLMGLGCISLPALYRSRSLDGAAWHLSEDITQYTLRRSRMPQWRINSREILFAHDIKIRRDKLLGVLSVLVASLFLGLFISIQRTLVLCLDFGSGSFDLSALISCPGNGGSSLSCEDFASIATDYAARVMAPFCAAPAQYCSAASLSHAGWMSIDVGRAFCDNFGDLYISCTYANQGMFLVGLIGFALLAIPLFSPTQGKDILPSLPKSIETHLKRAHLFFKTEGNPPFMLDEIVIPKKNNNDR